MKRLITYPTLLLVALSMIITSCKKEAASTSGTSSSGSGIIVLGVLAKSSSGATTRDTLVLVNCYGPKARPDSVPFSSLPASIGTYLSANYSGYTFNRAFKLDSASVTTGYVVVIKYNSNFVGLKFDAAGTFVKVLEQRDKADVGKDHGFHPGGPFPDRGAPQKDTLALSAIPSVVKSAFSSKYPSDTLLHALVAPDTTFILISKNNGLFSTAISKTGSILQRTAIPQPAPGAGKITNVAQSSLPTAVLSYLSSTYPSYVFNQALSVSSKGVLQGYVVMITANSTQYSIVFNASGTFVKAITLH